MPRPALLCWCAAYKSRRPSLNIWLGAAGPAGREGNAARQAGFDRRQTGDPRSGEGRNRGDQDAHRQQNLGYSTVQPVFVRKVVQAVKDGGKPFVTDANWDARDSATDISAR
jgi:hypothetical protein